MIPASAFSRFKNEPLVVATGYDYPFAQILEEAGVDVILVGDSLANVVLGLPTTRGVDMEVMAVFVAAAARGAPETHVTADMPFGSDRDPAQAVLHARRFLSLGAHSVKVEGAKLDVVRTLVAEGIPVMGHVGLLPQTAASFRQVGVDADERRRIEDDAAALEEAGSFALVLEHMHDGLAADITRQRRIPTVGIGAGPGADGQVLVLHDMLGLARKPPPPFARAFAAVREEALRGARAYCEAVRSRAFPA